MGLIESAQAVLNTSGAQGQMNSQFPNDIMKIKNLLSSLLVLSTGSVRKLFS